MRVLWRGRSLLLAIIAGPCFLIAAPEKNPRAAFDQGNPFELAELSSTLPPQDSLSLFYKGYIAASLRDSKTAFSALTPFIKNRAAPFDLRAEAVSTLAGVALREGRYAEAVKWLQIQLSEYSSDLNDDTRKEVLQSLGVAKVLARAPRQKTVRRQNGKIAKTIDKAGLSRVSLTINDRPGTAVFDTGANFSVVSESMAQRLGLKNIPGAIEVKAATGNTVTGRMAIGRTLVIGDAAFQQVPFLVFQDKDLSFPQIDYSIELMVGFPVIVELGCIQVRKDSIEIVDSLPKSSPSNLALESLTPLIAVNYENRTLPFLLDTGANASALSASFVKNFPEVLKNAELGSARRSGAGNIASTPEQRLRPVIMTIGSTQIALSSLAEGTGATSTAKTFGTIGNDVIFQGSGYELDFTTMHFRLLDK